MSFRCFSIFCRYESFGSFEVLLVCQSFGSCPGKFLSAILNSAYVVISKSRLTMFVFLSKSLWMYMENMGTSMIWM